MVKNTVYHSAAPQQVCFCTCLCVCVASRNNSSVKNARNRQSPQWIRLYIKIFISNMFTCSHFHKYAEGCVGADV